MRLSLVTLPQFDASLTGWWVLRCISEMLASGHIKLSASPWSDPVVLVLRRMMGNNITVNDAYPIPRIDDTLDMLAEKKLILNVRFGLQLLADIFV